MRPHHAPAPAAPARDAGDDDAGSPAPLHEPLHSYAVGRSRDGEIGLCRLSENEACDPPLSVVMSAVITTDGGGGEILQLFCHPAWPPPDLVTA
ncbi:hypothetical protein NSPZN2_30431 [Nitrospira defluvii]|uniref:Uncharacterized protein n=1 Tax=Nitrospira defluvii TaxID=330214 RepID=A0ABN7LPA2_9BACT|nr:hypothetical protein NSPZN2_30431 [Nitrospira defluvii]